MSSRFTRFLQRYRVFSGFLFAFIYLFFSAPSVVTLAAGFGIAAFGILIRAWACGHIRKTRELDTSGPYAFTRNPLYFGTLIITIGFGVASGVWWLVLLSLLFFSSIYFPVINVEAEELENVIGDEYREYAEAVPLFLPRLTPWKKSERRFDFPLYLKHGEYLAATGSVLAAAVLAAKIYFFR